MATTNVQYFFTVVGLTVDLVLVNKLTLIWMWAAAVHVIIIICTAYKFEWRKIPPLCHIWKKMSVYNCVCMHSR